jgi:YbgC/YbaW family acyl-CoA thioester hydrolase
MAIPFRTRRRVEFADTDMAGIIHFANFFRFMEAAEVDFLQSLGLSVTMRTETGDRFGFPRVSASCDFIKPVTFLDLLDITVRVAKVGTKSVTYNFEFAKGSEIIARGQITAVCCRFVPERPIESIPIPASIRAKLEEHLSPSGAAP